jgi:hypothetical protein
MTAKEKYADLSVNISVSPCEDAEIIGYDNHQINRITIRIAQFWLFMGARLIFGHDWRDDGVMRAVADFAETASSDGSLRAHVSIKNQKDEKPWRLLNVVPEKSREQLNQRAVHAERNTSGLLKVMTVSELVKTLSKAERSRETGNYSSLPENWFEQEYSRY